MYRFSELFDEDVLYNVAIYFYFITPYEYAAPDLATLCPEDLGFWAILISESDESFCHFVSDVVIPKVINEDNSIFWNHFCVFFEILLFFSP